VTRKRDRDPHRRWARTENSIVGLSLRDLELTEETRRKLDEVL
jgi:hypothetical protein